MKQIHLFACALLAAIMLISGCHRQGTEGHEGDEYSGTISISGAFALYPLTVKWAEEYQKLHPKVRIDISAGGAGKGMADALSRMVDLGMFSRGIMEEEKAKGCWWVAVAKDAVLPVVNSENPWIGTLKEKGISQEGLKSLYLSENRAPWSRITQQEGDHPINVYTRSDACGAAQMWGEFLGKDQESLRGTGVFGDPGMADAVKRDKYGIGYNNVIYIYDLNSRKCYPGLEVLPVDLNGDGIIGEEEQFYSTIDDIMIAIAQDRYPSPPARDLYFVAQGKPVKKVTIEFIRWILTEGQKRVNEAGYVKLSDEAIQSELEKISR